MSGSLGWGSGVTAPTARLQVRDTAAPQVRVERDSGNYLDIAVSSAGVVTFDAVGGSSAFLFGDAVTFTESITLADAKHIITNTANGSIIATSTSQKLGFWGKTPIVQPTTGVAAATRTAGAATAILTDDTFDGYTVAQAIKALRNTGLLA
ncbi:MAG: hypothetical protein IPL32_20430 [Chloracidobacterium sp.]|nr:hypothetical protein [Chloracidobacterium sp.]